MNTTKLSSKGQVIIPKSFRIAHHWEHGQELIVTNTIDGVFLRPKTPFLETNLEDVASCLNYKGKPKSLKDMEDAIKQGIKERFCDSN